MMNLYKKKFNWSIKPGEKNMNNSQMKYKWSITNEKYPFSLVTTEGLR